MKLNKSPNKRKKSPNKRKKNQKKSKKRKKSHKITNEQILLSILKKSQKENKTDGKLNPNDYYPQDQLSYTPMEQFL